MCDTLLLLLFEDFEGLLFADLGLGLVFSGLSQFALLRCHDELSGRWILSHLVVSDCELICGDVEQWKNLLNDGLGSLILSLHHFLDNVSVIGPFIRSKVLASLLQALRTKFLSSLACFGADKLQQ